MTKLINKLYLTRLYSILYTKKKLIKQELQLLIWRNLLVWASSTKDLEF